eukprot:GHVU01155372.1.p1 GENE.GHVU01155372.1~~GHVU01155372.1.p1  ORF type:complete len:172 (+),score=13.53 GHVU01155372.1:68-517(+)
MAEEDPSTQLIMALSKVVFGESGVPQALCLSFGGQTRITHTFLAADKLQSLINSWKWWESERLERNIHDDIEDLPDEFLSLNTKLSDFFSMWEGASFTYGKRECFTCGCNSQSGLEAIFAITSHLKIGKEKSLLCCVQRLISLCRNSGV